MDIEMVQQLAGVAGFLAKAPGTGLAFEPLRADDIDPITGDLPLY